MIPVPVHPGYNPPPADTLFGPKVDLAFWRGILNAGYGPITAAHDPSIACMRTAPAPFRICPSKYVYF